MKPAIPMLHLDGFDGPMDLLLDVAELRRIDELAHMRAAAGWLQARPQVGQDVVTRPLAPARQTGH
jgi:chromatin segregation and condensation protein Rec8/ScpA/Scc1 (kleisin family)